MVSFACATSVGFWLGHVYAEIFLEAPKGFKPSGPQRGSQAISLNVLQHCFRAENI